MANFSTRYSVRLRPLVLFCAMAWLSIAGFSSVTAHFSITLRDYARSDYIRAKISLLPMSFEKIMTTVLDCMVIAAIPSALVSVFGFVLTAHPRLLQDGNATAIYFTCTQFILSVVVLFIGGYVANSIQGYQTLFEGFDVRANHLPYYGMMYYGGIGEAVFGSLVIILSLGYFVI